ncbi:MAG TPA: hypothetical protein VH309_11210 [Elusimicrobiota bacterium]|nr:hypothetical protein [Elusimicrobiota bacterium]
MRPERFSMIDDTLAKIKALKAELAKLEAEHAAQASKVSGLADAAAREAARKPPSAKGVGLAIEGLADAAKGLEATHPNLFAAVAEICRDLSSLGI